MYQKFSCYFIIMLASLVSAGCHTFYLSSSYSSCPGAKLTSCMTLAQIAASRVIQDKFNLTIIFLPGNHTLDTLHFTIAGIPYVSLRSMVGDCSSRYVINCHRSSKFKFKFNRLVHISGLTFNGCMESEVNQVGEFTMVDCLLVGGESLSGRGLVATKSMLYIRWTNFTLFHGCTSQKGGALYCSQSNVRIADCMFTQNSANGGAALYIEENSTVVVSSTSILDHRTCSIEVVNEVHGAVFVHASSVIFSDCSMNHNSYSYQGNISTSNMLKGGALTAFESKVSISGCTFIYNIAFNGGAVHCDRGQLKISSTNFTLNTATNSGGAVHQTDCDTEIKRSNFSNNIGMYGGVLYSWSSLQSIDGLTVADSKFHNNSAHKGGAAYINSGIVKISGCLFNFNEAAYNGGAFILLSTNATIYNSIFENNKAESIGGAMFCLEDSQILILHMASFENNSAFYGAAIHLYGAKELVFNGKISIVNNNSSVGIIGVINSKANFSGDVSFAENVGSLLAFGGFIYISGNVNFSGHRFGSRKEKSKLNTLETKEGGCITLLLSKTEILASGLLLLRENTAVNGGGILAISSNIDIFGGVLYITSSNATDTGGGVYLYQSKLYIGMRGYVNISDNKAKNFGGGIHAISSLIVLHIQKADMNVVLLYLQSNTARRGGGVCLEVNSKFVVMQIQLRMSGHNSLVQPPRPVHLFSNSANFGGAIYVADDTNIGMCSSGQPQMVTAFTIHSECFFQISGISHDLYKFGDVFSFGCNFAKISGSLLYGGLFDRCTVSSFSHGSVKYLNVPGYANDVLNVTSSEPVKLYLCDGNGGAIHDHEPCEVTVKKGETFTLKVVAVDQVNHTINATVHTYLSKSVGTLGTGPKSFNTESNCTDLAFTILSPKHYEELVLYADGPCKELGISSLKIRVNFYPCYCPEGFEHLESIQDRCTCICHNILLSLPFIKDTDCNETTLTLIRSKSFWISVTNETFIICENCPSDYCFPSLPPISIDLDIPNGVDAQCNFNRSGMLCGRCQKGLTLSIGSSRCIECPDYWPVTFIAVTVGTLLAGLALVALLLLSNLTVAAGTLNGVIFYVNVFSANRGLFMPFHQTNFHSVFIAWLNLDIGFDICFIKGMDSYVKAWLQITFPVYLILVVIAIMTASKYSVKFSRVIAPKNPVATLATLILLSYTKLLNSVITALSFTTLSYIQKSSGRHLEEKRWLYDASLPYLSGKCIPLFIVAVVIMVLGIAYTFLLLFWQWLVLLPDIHVFRWLRNTKLSSFIDAYHAPFTVRNRYWTGLLLLSRVILLLTAATNVSGKPSINLLAVSLVVGCILLLQGYTGIRTYKKWMLNMLEFTSYFNILAFCMAKFYVLLTEGNHTSITVISISIEFILFLFIIIYHTTIETKSLHKVKKCKWYKSHFHKDMSIPFLSNYQDQKLVSNQTVTTTRYYLILSQTRSTKSMKQH